MKKFIVFIITAIIFCGGIMSCSRKPTTEEYLRPLFSMANQYIAEIDEQMKVNYDSLYRSTKFADWDTIDQKVKTSEKKLDDVERSLWGIYESINTAVGEDSLYNKQIWDIESYLNKRSLFSEQVNKIRENVAKKKYPKEYAREQKEKKEIAKLAAQMYRYHEEQKAIEKMRKQYKETYTITQTPYGAAVSVSYTKK
jgi:hypothetical protein